MATTKETTPGNVAHVRRFCNIPRNHLWFETQQMGYFEVTSRIPYLTKFTRSMLQAWYRPCLKQAEVGPFELLNVRQVLTLCPKSEVTLKVYFK